MTLTEQARDRILEGNTRLRRRDFSGAVVVYDDAIRLAPGCAEAYHNRGVAGRAPEDTAVADGERALQINPAYAEAEPLLLEGYVGTKKRAAQIPPGGPTPPGRGGRAVGAALRGDQPGRQGCSRAAKAG